MKEGTAKMIRNLKTLGLSVVAVLALSAMVTSAAQATIGNAQATIEGGKGFIHGKDEVAGTLTRNGRTVTCTSAHYKSNTVLNGDTSITITPEYTNCHSAGLPATVTVNGCAFIFTFTADAGHTFTAISHLECPPNKVVEIHVYSSHNNHTAGTSLCTYHFGTVNINKTEVSLTNKAAGGTTPKDWITADITVGGIVSTRTSGSELLCGNELDNAGTLHASAELKGTDHAGGAAGITMSTVV
jgi:hypothetical protein